MLTQQVAIRIRGGMSAPKVFFTRRIPYAIEKCRELLPNAAISVSESETENLPRDELLKQSKGADGLFCLLSDKIDKEFLDSCDDKLRVVSTMSVGFNHIDVDECAKRGVLVGNTPGVLDTSTAETAVSLTFAVKRRVVECSDSARNGGWGTWQPFGYCGSDVSNSTVGVIGFGRIGRTYAKMLQDGFNCSVLYHGPNRKQEEEEEFKHGATYVDLETLLQKSDIVSIHAPLNAQTHHLVSEKELALMKESAVLINTSRGDLVDQQALVEALKKKKIAGAGLDVTTPEPLPTDHELFQLDNCTVLPHIGSATVSTRKAMLDIAVHNLVAGVTGEKLPHAVA